MDKIKLAGILSELRSASIQINGDPTESKWRETMNKYNMLFLGEKFNKILSVELAHSINTFFEIPVEIGDLNAIIPEVCDLLKMQYEPLIDLKDADKSNPPISCYDITLW